MTGFTLESGFEDKLRDALLTDIERKLADLIPMFVETAERNFREYAARNGYEIEHIWEDVTVSQVDRSQRAVYVRIEWPGLSALFEFGVDPHTINATGGTLLHFYWEAKDMWIKTEEVNWGSETGGISESRAIRDALDWFRAEVRET